MPACPSCGRPLAADWPSGICPRCLLSSEAAHFNAAEPGAEGAGGADARAVAGFPLPVCEDFDERYEFLDDLPVDRGGQGLVFRVRDRRLRRVVALKLLVESADKQASSHSRFAAEAQIASQLQHPGFLPIFDAGLDPMGCPYYTTSLLSGRTLKDVIGEVRTLGRNFDQELRRALELLLQLCGIMAYAHACGVCHRDLKPTNVLIGEYGEIYVIDLGSASVGSPGSSSVIAQVPGPNIETDRAAALSEDPGSLESTQKDGLPITWVFAPPEVIVNPAAPASPLADIYALGVILYELCAGRLPYARPDGTLPGRREFLQLVSTVPPAPIRGLASRIPRDLAAIAEKAMARNPAERYPAMAALGADLRAFLETRVVQARHPGPVAKLQKWGARHSRQLALASFLLASLVIAVAVGWSFKLKSDHAQQTIHLRAAQLAARSGQWRAVPGHLLAAEQAGYANRIDLALQRIEAWTVLSEHRLVKTELDKLLAQPRLGTNRGVALLRLAEHELDERTGAAAGLEHVRQALAAGLGSAETAFARGLLAETSPAALEHFQNAVRLDPFHHGAHRFSLGLEFLLGKFDALEPHFTVMTALYPEDPAPAFLQAIRMAIDGHVEDAEKLLGPHQAGMNPAAWQVFLSGLRAVRNLSAIFDLDAALRFDTNHVTINHEFLLSGLKVLIANQRAAFDTNSTPLSLPQLPCLKNGLDAGIRSLLPLLSPLSIFDRTEATVQSLERAGEIHPESLLVLVGAIMLENRRPAASAQSRAFLILQSRLFQRAAELPSILPGAPRLARYFAANAQWRLAGHFPAPDPQARQMCLENLRWFRDAPNTTSSEYRECFNLAFELRDSDLARELLSRWEHLNPGNAEGVAARIRLEMAAEAYPRALQLLDGILKDRPTNRWALDLRWLAVQQIRSLAKSRETEGPAPGER